MFTLTNVLSGRSPRVARAIRGLLVLFTLAGVSACGDATGLSRVDGTYSLRAVARAR